MQDIHAWLHIGRDVVSTITQEALIIHVTSVHGKHTHLYHPLRSTGKRDIQGLASLYHLLVGSEAKLDLLFDRIYRYIVILVEVLVHNQATVVVPLIVGACRLVGIIHHLQTVVIVCLASSFTFIYIIGVAHHGDDHIVGRHVGQFDGHLTGSLYGLRVVHLTAL